MLWRIKNFLKTACGAAIFCLFLSCEFDHGLSPSTTKITGQVRFDDPNSRPSNVDEVRVVTVAKFDLNDLDLGDVYFSTAVRFDLDSAKYEISVPTGTYPLIGVLWKERGKNWDIKKIIGVYNSNCDTNFSPLTVQLTKDQPVVSNVNICAFWK